jgi:peptide/nickel transport system permease protein
MSKYVIRRLIQAIPTLFGITIISFVMMLSAPGDPVTLITFTPDSNPEVRETLKRQLGLDKSIPVQYLYWLIGNDWTRVDVDGDGEGDIDGTRKGFLRGDLGNSIQHKRPVTTLIMERIPATLQLAVASLMLGYVVGIPVGVFAAVNRGGWFDQISRVFAVLGNAVPAFWLGLILIMFFSVQLHWLPTGGMQSLTGVKPGHEMWDRITHLIMPTTVLALGTIATISRFMRAEVIEVLGHDYIRTAHAKGLSRSVVWWKHAVRNALIPVATFIGPALGSLLSGAVIIEQVFGWPGMGLLVVNAVFQRDYPLVMGGVLIGSVLFILGLILSDILYGILDPRIRLT